MTDARPDYKAFYDAFRPADLAADFSGSLDGGMNICTECVDRHPAEAVAVRYERADGAAGVLTFGDLEDGAARFANLLVEHGVKPGDRVAGLLPRGPELMIDLQVAGLTADRADYIARCLRRIYGVERVLLSEKQPA